MNVYPLFCLALLFEGDNSTDFCVKGIIASLADINPWMKFRTPLPDKDITGLDNLAAVHFYAEAF
jgi:hypothetical protein